MTTVIKDQYQVRMWENNPLPGSLKNGENGFDTLQEAKDYRVPHYYNDEWDEGCVVYVTATTSPVVVSRYVNGIWTDVE